MLHAIASTFCGFISLRQQLRLLGLHMEGVTVCLTVQLVTKTLQS